jgi:hypothetical protein
MLHCPRNIMRKIIFSGVFLATGLAPTLAEGPTGDWRVADRCRHPGRTMQRGTWAFAWEEGTAAPRAESESRRTEANLEAVQST